MTDVTTGLNEVDAVVKQILNSIYFVRVQSTEGISSNDRGEVFLKRPEKSSRNTFHFTVNSVVRSHAYGKFDGSAIVITRAQDVPKAPSGLGQVDTWFQADDQRQLSVGRATVLLPRDFECPKHLMGANIVRYDGNRVTAAEDCLRSMGVDVKQPGFWSWTDSDMSSTGQWREATAKDLYPQRRGHPSRVAFRLA
jgi:hypothetical protein